MTVIFDGKFFAKTKGSELKKNVGLLKKRGIKPTLTTIYLSSDPGSVLYTKLKQKTAESLGIKLIAFEFKKNNVAKIIATIKRLNRDKDIHGILVQKPSGKKVFSDSDWSKIILERLFLPRMLTECRMTANLSLPW